jgi:hypothetical protein
VKGSVVISNAGAPLSIVDDGEGALYDVGFVGVAANLRGSVDYDLGVIDFTYGAAPTQPVAIAYSHAGYVDFASPSQSSSKAAAAYPFEMQLGYGRVNPGSVVLADGTPLAFVDDGKGNMIETTGGGSVERGSINYGTGVLTLTSGSAALAGTVAVSYQFNPFAALLAGGGGMKLLDVYGQIPELMGEAWADGIKGEDRIGLWGEGVLSSVSSHVISQWVHFGEEPYRVDEPFSGVVPGGDSNNPSMSQSVAHL